MSFPKLMYMEKTHMHVMNCNAYNVNFHTLTADGVPIDISGHTTPGPPGPQGAQGITGPKGPMGGTGPAGGGDFIPIGSILIWTSTTQLPADYLLCDGSHYDPGTYPDLSNVISTTYGVDSVTANPLLPDLRGRNIFGECDMPSIECGVFDVSRASLISDISSNGVGDDKIPASQLWKHRHDGLNHHHHTNPRAPTDDANPHEGCEGTGFWPVGNFDDHAGGTYGGWTNSPYMPEASLPDSSHPAAIMDNADDAEAAAGTGVADSVKNTAIAGNDDAFVSPALVINFIIRATLST